LTSAYLYHGQIMPILLSDFVRNILDLYRSLGRRPLTVQKMTQVLGELEELLGPKATTADLTTSEIARWRAQACAGRAPGTVVGLLSYIRAACSYAVGEGFLERMPNFAKLRPKLPKNRVGPHQSLAELITLLDCLHARARTGGWKGRRDQAAFATAIYTGLRRDELLFLRRDDLDLPGGIIRVVPLADRELKTAESAQPVPIPPGLRPILEGYLPDAGDVHLFPGVNGKGAWHGGRVDSRPIAFLRRAGEACGVHGLSWQSLRRSWATHAESAWGLSDPQIQRVLRHTSPLISRVHYRAADIANLREIGGKVSFTRKDTP
jgi:integrase